MANIGTFLQKILDAVYGEEVRGSIHDAISAMNTESSKAMEYASTAKDSAQASATAAGNSASTASQKASAASTSAAAAKTSETNAKTSADAALSAKNSIEAAKNAAEAASSAAQTAKTAAEAAKNGAESARNTAAESAAAAARSSSSAEQYSGKPPKPQNGTWHIWDAKAQKYVDSKISCELEGPAGVGIDNIQLTSGDHAPGTVDIYTVTLTDGTAYNISVYNGRNGTGSGDVLGISFDLLIPASGWQNGEITVEDEQLEALSSYKYFVSADEASREQYIEHGVQAKDITSTGFITFKCNSVPTESLTVNVIRLGLSVNGTS